MPRLKSPEKVIPEILIEEQEPAPLAIPGVRHEHEHRIDPYQTIPGAVPQQDQPKRRPGRPKKDDELAKLAREQQYRLERYEHYLDALQASGGDIDLALSIVYRISNVQEAANRRAELLADVQSGVPGSSTTEILQRLDLGKMARLIVMRKWMYSNNPGASLKAADLINELDGQGPDLGSYEQFVKRVTEV